MIDAKISWKKALANIDFVIAGIMLIILVVLTIYGVIMRYVVGSPLTWIEEVQLSCMVWIVFSGAGGAFRTGGHVAIELLVESLPKKIQAIVNILVIIAVVFTLGYLLVQSIAYTEFFMNNGRSTSILQIPFWMIYGIAPIATLSMIVNYLYVQFSRLRELRREEPGT